MFEKILEPKLSRSFNNDLINEQHGFRTYKSTYTNLLVYVTNNIETMKKRKQGRHLHGS